MVRDLQKQIPGPLRDQYMKEALAKQEGGPVKQPLTSDQLVPYGGIIEESLRNSVFGTFGNNFEAYNQSREETGKDFGDVLNYFQHKEEMWNILSEKHDVAFVYFNLPMHIV